MNLIWHIVRKDLSRARWLLAGWLMLTCVPILVGLWVMTGGEDLWGITLPYQPEFQPIMMMLQIVIVFPIAAWVVHEDRLVGSTVHWPVLPISGGQLLVAKTCSLVLMLWVMPLLLSLPWWLGNGFGGKDVFNAVLHQGIILLPAIAVSLLMASLTEGMGRFFIGCLALYVALMAVGGGIASNRLQADGTTLPADVMASRLLLVTLAAAATVAVVVGHQFLRRRLGISLCLFAAGGSVVLLIAVGWRWNLLPARPSAANMVTVANPEIAIEWGMPTIHRTFRPPRTTMIRFENEATITGLKPSEFWTGRITSLQFSWKDGTVVSLEQPKDGKNTVGLSTRGRFIEPESMPADIFPRRDRVALVFNAELQDDVVKKMSGEAPSVSATIEGYVHQGEVLADLPLAKSEFHGVGSHRMAILDSERHAPVDQRLVVVFVEPAPPPWRRVSALPRPGQFPLFGLRGGGVFNGSDREPVKIAGRWGEFRATKTVLGHYAGVAISRQNRTATPPRIRPGSRAVIGDQPHGMDEQWLDDARVVWTREVLVSRHDTSFAVEQLKIPSSFALPFPPPAAGPPEDVVWPPDSMSEPAR